MHPSRPPLFLFLMMLALLAGCDPQQTAQPSSLGTVHLAASTRQALSSGDISRLVVTSSASDIPSIVTELVRTDGVWGGVVGNIPAGPNRSFRAQAFDSAGTLRYEGLATGITVVAQEVTLVTLSLQDVSAPAPYGNEAPLIASVVASPLVVQPGGSVTLQATARDPNPGDSLTFAWSASSGTFSTPTGASTQWIAPTTAGLATLTLTVSDSHGAASSVSLSLRVSAGEGGAVVNVSFNSRPAVLNVTSSQSTLNVGQQTLLLATAADSDGDVLSYQWSASCQGTWQGADTSSARFTPTALPSEACNNCRLTVAVSDGRGGLNHGTLALCVAPVTTNHLPPVVVRTYQSSLVARPSQSLTFEVVASDPEGSPLSFSWNPAVGTLGTVLNQASSSRVTWMAPACVPAGSPAALTATVTNGFGLATTQSFSVTGLPSCSSSPTAGTLDLGPNGSYFNHIRADGMLLFTCSGLANGSNLCRYENPTSGGTALQADLTGDGQIDRTFRSGGSTTVLWSGTQPANIMGVTSDTQGNVYFSVYDGAHVIKKLDAQANFAASTWQTNHGGRALTADGTYLYTYAGGPAPTSIIRFHLATGAMSSLSVSNLPTESAYVMDTHGGYIYLATHYEIGRFPASGGAYERIAGTGVSGYEAPFTPDGANANSIALYTVGIGLDARGKLFFSDMHRDGVRLRYIEADGTVRTVNGFTPGVNAGLTLRGQLLMAQNTFYRVSLMSPLP